jgi:hypothetical protein
MAKSTKRAQKGTKRAASEQRFQEETVRSLPQYIRVVNRIHDSWSGPSFTPDPWYRGVGDAARHKLLPGFYRLPANLTYLEEDDYREEFMRRAPQIMDGHPPADHWEWYFLMQHYGLPTRLLDWTEGALTGLFFALEDFRKLDEPSADAAVWMLDPWYLNRWSINSGEILVYNEKRATRYLCESPFDEDRWPRKPAAIMPKYSNRRLSAQRGMFTIHGKWRKPLEEVIPRPRRGSPRLAKIIIPKNSIPTMREQLRRTGVTDVVLFPELSSLALDMRRSWERP